ncbi:MAG: thioesterase family protein [Tissierellia bacterium]|nr:thioesterase family protein [Tissierellia bacterium]
MLGVKGKLKKTVDESMTAKVAGSGTLDVFATPCMIALVEETCWRSIDDFIDSDSTTVGTNVEVKHLAATAVGVDVECESEVIEHENNRILFQIEVRDEFNLIARGIHERYIVNRKKFLSKIKKSEK